MRPPTSTTQGTCSKQPERVLLCIHVRASRTGPRGQLSSTAHPVWRRRFSRGHPAVSLTTRASEFPSTVLCEASGPSSRILTLLVNVKWCLTVVLSPLLLVSLGASPYTCQGFQLPARNIHSFTCLVSLLALRGFRDSWDVFVRFGTSHVLEVDSANMCILQS